MKYFTEPAFEERFLKLANTERGLFITLYCWSRTRIGGSIPRDPEECWNEIRNFAGISKRRFLTVFATVLDSLEAIL